MKYYFSENASVARAPTDWPDKQLNCNATPLELLQAALSTYCTVRLEHKTSDKEANLSLSLSIVLSK